MTRAHTPNNYPSSDEEFLRELEINPCTCNDVTPSRVASNLRRAEVLMEYFDAIKQDQQPSAEQKITLA